MKIDELRHAKTIKTSSQKFRHVTVLGYDYLGGKQFIYITYISGYGLKKRRRRAHIATSSIVFIGYDNPIQVCAWMDNMKGRKMH